MKYIRMLFRFAPFWLICAGTCHAQGVLVGDRLVVGSMTPDAFSRLQTIPLPAIANQKFCGLVRLSSGITAEVYVPTAAERGGDFSPFAGLLLDPLAFNAPFPGGVIPSNRIPGTFAWRISSGTTGGIPPCVDFPSGFVPFTDVFYTSNIIAATDRLVLGTASLAFSQPSPTPGIAGGGPPSQTFTLSTAGGARLPFTAVPTVTTPANVSWLSLSPATGTTPVTVTVIVNAGSLGVGTYSGRVTVTAAGATNNSQVVNVSFTIGGPAPSTNALVIPSLVKFVVDRNNPQPPAQKTLSITSTVPGIQVPFTVAANALGSAPSWVVLEQNQGVTPFKLNMSVNPALVPIGRALQLVTVTSSGPACASIPALKQDFLQAANDSNSCMQTFVAEADTGGTQPPGSAIFDLTKESTTLIVSSKLSDLVGVGSKTAVGPPPAIPFTTTVLTPNETEMDPCATRLVLVNGESVESNHEQQTTLTADPGKTSPPDRSAYVDIAGSGREDY